MPAVPTSKIERLVSAYSFGGEGKMTKIEEGAGLAVAGNSWTTPGGVYNGSGGLAGTVGDYFRFATMLCNKGLGSTGARILGTRTVEFMALNHLTGEEEIDTGGRTSFTEFGQRMPGIDFGIGMAVSRSPAESQVLSNPGDYWWGGAYVSCARRLLL